MIEDQVFHSPTFFPHNDSILANLPDTIRLICNLFYSNLTPTRTIENLKKNTWNCLKIVKLEQNSQRLDWVT